ncbi:MAG: MFS transporter [Afipia sp.]|nr:MFS transporter [Afipia sp.]
MPESKVIGSGPVSVGAPVHYPIIAVIAVLLGSSMANIDSRMFSIGLPDIKGALSLSFDEGAWLSTASTASQIFIAPAVAWLATVFGLRRILGAPSLVFAVISLIIPFVRDYQTLMVLTILHGLLIGTFVPATLMIIFRNLPMRWWLLAIGIYALRVGFSLNFGPALVGIYPDKFGWQWLYWQDAIVAMLMALLVYVGAPREPVNRKLLENADWGGMLLLGAGIAMVYSGLDQGNRLDWLGSGTVVALLGSGAALLVAFFVNETLVRDPWAHASVLLSRNIGFALLVILFYTLTGLSNSSLVPNFLSSIAQLRPEQTGALLLVCGVLPMAVLFPLSLWLVHRFDVRLVLMTGLMAFAAAALLGTQITNQWRLNDFVPIVLLQSVGQTFTLLPIILITLANSDPTRATAFAAYVQIMRLGGAEIGIALMGTWLRVREQVHSNLLGQHVTHASDQVAELIARLSAHFASHGTGTATGRSIGTLAGIVQRESNVLAYIDAFWLTFGFAIAGLLLTALITRAPPGPFTPGAKAN